MKKSLTPYVLFLAFLLPFAGFAQGTPEINARVSGKIIDAKTREGLAGATVSIKGTTNGASTNANGDFALITGQKLPFTLIVSSVGYNRREVEVTESKVEIELEENVNQLAGVTITSRRRQEIAQDVPIPITVIRGVTVDEAGAFNVTRLKEFVPSLQLYTSNPRNTGVNIRGLGSPFGLTNDGLDPGVGFYIDGVYFARPAVATLDFIDVENIEILRGPQGTLFGKNTTAGAFNITTRKASFTPGATFETSFGNYAYFQTKASITGPIAKKIAGRVSFTGTQRNGTIENIVSKKWINDMNNFGLRGQLLFLPTDNTSITLAGDFSRQRPDGFAQVPAGVVTTQRAAYRQFNNIIADLNYQLPSLNAFDRKIDQDTPWNSDNDLGGASLNIDTKLGPGTLTATTSWRYWDWGPSNDRDFTGLPVLRKSQNPSKHHNFTQEVRYAGEFSSRLSGVLGLFFIDQEVKVDGTEESGSAQWRFSQSSTSALWKTPGLFEGYGIKTNSTLKSQSAAAFTNIDWEVAKGFHIQPGLRYNYDKKDVDYKRVAYGGLETTDPALIALKTGVYSSQAYTLFRDETNFTYNITAAYKYNKRLNAYATYSTSFKPVGVNVAGLPTVNGQPALDLAVIQPENVKHAEFGIKSSPAENFILNATFFNTDITNYQTNVQSPQLGVNRGYIANADKVNVKGAEVDANLKANEHFSFYGSVAYTDAKYVKFVNAPLPLEETGKTDNGVQVAFKDISGGRLPGISKWAGSFGGEFVKPATFLAKPGKFFIAADGFFRSEFSSSPSPSAYLNIDGYALFNARFGFKTTNGLSVTIWGRNIFNKDYYEQLLPAGGNAGLYAGVLGDPRTYGITLRYSL